MQNSIALHATWGKGLITACVGIRIVTIHDWNRLILSIYQNLFSEHAVAAAGCGRGLASTNIDNALNNRPLACCHGSNPNQQLHVWYWCLVLILILLFTRGHNMLMNAQLDGEIVAVSNHFWWSPTINNHLHKPLLTIITDHSGTLRWAPLLLLFSLLYV